MGTYPEDEDAKEQLWVRVMCDFCATGLWGRNGPDGFPEGLELSSEMHLRLRRWQDRFENLFSTEDGNWGLASDDELVFGKEGFDIACDIKQKNPDWTVYYNDQRRDCWSVRIADNKPWIGPSDLRPWFEYEITLEVIKNGDGPSLESVIAEITLKKKQSERQMSCQ